MLGAEELGAPWLGTGESKMKHGSYSETFSQSHRGVSCAGVGGIMTKQHVNTVVQTRRAAKGAWHEI